MKPETLVRANAAVTILYNPKTKEWISPCCKHHPERGEDGKIRPIAIESNRAADSTRRTKSRTVAERWASALAGRVS